MPTTAKIKIIMTRTNVKFPNAPIVLPIIDIRRLSVGHDLANLNTRNLNYKTKNVEIRILNVNLLNEMIVKHLILLYLQDLIPRDLM